MVEAFFSSIFIERFKIIISAILIYVVIYALLVKIKPFGADSKVNSLIALLSAIIVSFSGVVTYAIMYAINWFVIIFFIIFLAMVLMMFLGVKPADISNAVSGKTALYIGGAFALLFLVILVKSFFALNNSFDTQNPQIDQYNVDTTYNNGFSDKNLNSNENSNNYNSNTGFFDKLTANKDLLYIVLFLVGIGIFIILIG